MKKLTIYEPAMCCPTGLCGVGIDKELLRISIVLSNLEKNGVEVERFNLTNTPQEFIKNQKLNDLMMEEGVEILPVTIVNNEIVKTASYPTNDELAKFLDVPTNFVEDEKSKAKKDNILKTVDDCCSGDGCC